MVPFIHADLNERPGGVSNFVILSVIAADGISGFLDWPSTFACHGSVESLKIVSKAN